MCAARLPRLDRQPRPAGHAGRARAAPGRHGRPTGSTAARTPASDHGGLGGRPVRGRRTGGRGLRRYRGGDLSADRRSLAGRVERHPLRLHGLLPGGAAVRASRAVAHAVSTAGARGSKPRRAVGRRCGGLQRHLRCRPERPPRVARPGAGRRRAQPRLQRPAMARRRPDARAVARAGDATRVPARCLDRARRERARARARGVPRRRRCARVLRVREHARAGRPESRDDPGGPRRWAAARSCREDGATCR